MHTVVHRLTFLDPVDPTVFTSLMALRPELESIEGFQAAHVVQTGEREVVLIIVGRDAATLDRIADDVGGRWMMRHVVPRLSVAPERVVGPVLASTEYDAR